MVEKKGLKYHRGNSELTSTEKEILHLITEEFLTIKQIQLQRKCSLQAIYKHLKNIKKKGYLGSGLNMVEKKQPTIQPNDIRLHAQEFNIKILWQDSYYQKSLKKNNIIFIDGNTIKLYRNSIEIYSGNSFVGKSGVEAEVSSINYWKKFFASLEHTLKITILKPKSRNIKLVNQHFARGDSEVCDNAIENKDKIRVFAEEDGKLCFITDDSFGFREDETVHPSTAKPDRKAIDKQVNDWRLNNPPTLSEIWQITAKNTLQSNVLTNTLSDYAKHIKAHTKSIVSLSKAIPQLTKLLKETKEENTKLKQRKLAEFF